MGRIDVEIDIERGSRRKDRNCRTERLGTRSTPDQPGSNLAPHSTHSGIDTTPDQPDSNLAPHSRHCGSDTIPDQSDSDLALRSAHCGIDTKDHEVENQMDLTLYLAARQSEDYFTSVLHQVAKEKGLMLSVVFAQVSPVGNTYLHVAANFNNVAIISFIAYHSPPLMTKKNFNGDTALHLAARAGHTLTVKTLLTIHQDIVDFASGEGGDERQLDQENLLRLRNENGNTALHEAVMNSHDEIAYYLIHADPQVAFCLNNERESPLYLAVKAGSKECISLILSFQKELRNMNELMKDGKSPVHAAIRSRNRDALELLFQKAPKFIHFIDEGKFPLHYAASMGYLEEVHYILDKFPSSANERDPPGLLSIHWASIKGHIDIMKELLLHWPEPAELCDRCGRNILHFAAKSGKDEVVSYILKDPTFEGLINMKDKQGNTPLHLATMHWHPKIVSALTWDTKVNLTLVNDQGMTALDAAEYYMDNASSFQQVRS